jgi:ADP-ribose pyrophosphatase YjhB (NUDIX family)
MKSASRWIGRGVRGRLPRPLYELVCKLMPVTCIDVLPYRASGEGFEIGLIERRDTEGKVVWCLIGGGIHRRESLADSAARHIHATLGPDVGWEAPDYRHPGTIGEYVPERRSDMPHDPRKHAIALTYAIALDGEPSPRGEALDFRWFSPGAIPFERMGFGQDAVLRDALSTLRADV